MVLELFLMWEKSTVFSVIFSKIGSAYDVFYLSQHEHVHLTL